MLTASEISTFCYSIKVCISDTERHRFLDPIRDLYQISDWLEEKIDHDYKVLLVGKDLDILMTRIKDPHKYWSSQMYKEKVTIWPVVVGSAEQWRKELAKHMDMSGCNSMFAYERPVPSEGYHDYYGGLWWKTRSSQSDIIVLSYLNRDQMSASNMATIMHNHGAFESGLISLQEDLVSSQAVTSYINLRKDPHMVLQAKSRRIVSIREILDRPSSLMIKVGRLNKPQDYTMDVIEIPTQ